jgi:glycolate oxidase
MFPPDPASQRSSTLGGNLGENAGGIKGVKCGLTKHHTLGLEVALADGRVIRTGRLARGPEAAGPDLTGLFLASEGTLGLVTRALLKITPLPAGFRTVSAVFADLGAAGRAVASVIGAGLIPTAMEIMDQSLIAALEDYLRLGFPRDAEAMLLIEVDGLGPELDPQMDRIVELCRQAGATEIKAADAPRERDALWLARRSGNGAMGRLKPATIVQDVAVPIKRLPDMLRLVRETARRHDLLIVQMAHAGDGNLHPHILYDPGDPAEYGRALEASRDIFLAALEAGGTLTGEHGVGLEKVAFMPRQFTPDELAFMGRLKKALDPRGLFNPGKILPEAESR